MPFAVTYIVNKTMFASICDVDFSYLTRYREKKELLFLVVVVVVVVVVVMVVKSTESA
jgi:t-SNARE complex subunit (syntaxin)